MPTFLVTGTGKAGTTSLFRYLRQHPDVYMSPLKEPHFFAFGGEQLSFHGPGDREVMDRVITDLEEYRSLFAGASGETAIGEASQSYLDEPKAPARIRRHIPDVRVVVMLRNPVERAYSAYLQVVRAGDEWLNFVQALREEDARVSAGWGGRWRYRGGGFYHEHLQRYYEVFGREHIRVHLYEDIKEDPVQVTRDVFGFVGVDDTFVPDTSHSHNVSGLPRSRALQSFVQKPSKLKTALKPLLPERTRTRVSASVRSRNLAAPPSMPHVARSGLTEVYRDEVLKLQEVIGRDLTAWLDEDRRR